MWCVKNPMKNYFMWSMRALGHGAIVFMAVGLVFSGCKKQEEEKPPAPPLPTVYSDRANDKAYISSLKANHEQQAQVARERFNLSLKMTQCVTRVRGALPSEATAEVVQKALEADPTWQELDSQIKRAEAASKETLKQAQEMVRKRMKDEMRDNEALSKGAAKALDSAQSRVPAEVK
jgi:hypothetical protein